MLVQATWSYMFSVLGFHDKAVNLTSLKQPSLQDSHDDSGRAAINGETHVRPCPYQSRTTRAPVFHPEFPGCTEEDGAVLRWLGDGWCDGKSQPD